MADETGKEAPPIRRRRTPRASRVSKPREAKKRPPPATEAPTPERLEDIEQSVLRARKRAHQQMLRGH